MMTKTNQFILAVVMAAALPGCKNATDQGAKAESIQGVYVTVPGGDASTAAHQYTAAVEEGKSVNAGFKTGGQIKHLSVKEGDYVRKGQVIGVLDDADYRLSVSQLEAQYNQLTSEVKRLDEMFKRNNIAANDYEKAKAGLAQVKAQLDMTRNKLSYTRLEAPSSGYIVERYMEDGEMAGAGTPVYRILDNSSLETSVALPAAIYSRQNEIVRCVGTSAVTGDDQIPLEIISFVPDGDNNSLFRLRLRIPSNLKDKLLPGMSMSVRLDFDGGDKTGYTVVPSRALFERNGKEYVWVVDPQTSTISAREVTLTGSHSGPMSTVTGLTGSETIVAAGVHHLADNEKVRVLGDIKDLNK